VPCATTPYTPSFIDVSPTISDDVLLLLRVLLSREKQAALDAEEARRKNVATDAAVRLRKDIGEQCGAREAERVAELQQKRRDLEKVMADLEVCCCGQGSMLGSRAGGCDVVWPSCGRTVAWPCRDVGS
jgi:hypothetical protein